MPRGNAFQRRKAKRAGDLARRKERRAPYAKVLIVCEGEKTEPHYFKGLIDHYGLNTANVEVCGDCGSDPRSIIDHARQRYRREKDSGDRFDRVYCVFDKDAHSNYAQAIDAIDNAAPKGVYTAITSVPCFEYWLLLHYNYTTRPYADLPGNSAGNQVLTELKRYIPDYDKGTKDTFPALVDRLDTAKQNATRALRAADEDHTDNPTTRVHELVDFLQNIKNSA